MKKDKNESNLINKILTKLNFDAPLSKLTFQITFIAWVLICYISIGAIFNLILLVIIATIVMCLMGMRRFKTLDKPPLHFFVPLKGLFIALFHDKITKVVHGENAQEVVTKQVKMNYRTTSFEKGILITANVIPMFLPILYGIVIVTGAVFTGKIDGTELFYLPIIGSVLLLINIIVFSKNENIFRYSTIIAVVLSIILFKSAF